MKNDDDEAAKFKEPGLGKVKKNLAEGIYGGQRKQFAEAWVKEQEQLNAKEYQNRSEHRDEEALNIAKEANRISEEANNLSKKANKKSCIANICSIVALLISVVSIL